MKILPFIILSLILVSVIIGVVRYKKATAPFKLLIIYLILTLVSECISEAMAKLSHNNMIMYHIFAPVEYVFYTLIYRKIFSGKLKQIITYLMIPVLAFALINSLFFQKTNTFPSNFLLSYQVIFLFYALMGFRQMLLDPKQVSIYKQSFFWLNLSLMLFSTTLFLYFGLLNFSIRHGMNIDSLTIFSSVVNIIYYILLSTTILIDSSKREIIERNEDF